VDNVVPNAFIFKHCCYSDRATVLFRQKQRKKPWTWPLGCRLVTNEV